MATKHSRTRRAQSAFLYGFSSAFDLGFNRMADAKNRIHELQNRKHRTWNDDMLAIAQDKKRIGGDFNRAIKALTSPLRAG